MKMLLSATDEGKVSLARTTLFHAGIPCEIRQSPQCRWDLQSRLDAELWVCHDGDVIKAMKLLRSPAPDQLAPAFGAS